MADLLISIGADASAYKAGLQDAVNVTNTGTAQISSAANNAGNAINGMGTQAQSASMRFIQMRSGLSAMRDGTLAFAVGGQRADMMLMAMGHHITSLVNETGSLSGAFASMGRSLMGAGGVILLITIAFEAYKKITKESEEATKDYVSTLDSVRQAQLKGQQEGQGEITRLQILYKATQDHTLSLKDRNLAYDELEKKYPKFFDNAEREKTLLGENGKLYNELANAILSAANAKAYENQIGENSNRIFTNIQKGNDKIKIQKENQVALDKEIASLQKMYPEMPKSELETLYGDRFLGYIKNIKDAKTAVSELNSDTGKLNKANSDLADLALKNEQKAGFKTGGEDEGKGAKEKALKAAKDGFAALTEQITKAQLALQDGIIAGKTGDLTLLVNNLDNAIMALNKFKKAYDDAINNQHRADFIKQFGSLNPLSTQKVNPNEINNVNIPENKKADVGAALNENAKELEATRQLYDAKLITDKDYLARKYFLEESSLNLEQSLYASDSKEYASYTNRKSALTLKFHEEVIKETSQQKQALKELVSVIGTGFKDAFEKALSGSENFFTGMGHMLVALIEKLIAAAAEAAILFAIISLIPGASEFLGIAGSFGQILGGTSGLSAYTTSVPAHAAGGIFTQPHVGMFGEAGPEAIVTPKHLQEFAGINGTGGGTDLQLSHTLTGSDLTLWLTRANKSKGRTT